MMRFEHKSRPLLPRRAFLRRLAAHGGIAILAIAVSLLIGVLSYHALAGLSWLDALLNASMILGGEGPVNPMPNSASKVFASLYALYSGLILLVSVGFFFTPIFHRIIHRFHLERESRE